MKRQRLFRKWEYYHLSLSLNVPICVDREKGLSWWRFAQAPTPAAARD